MAGLIEACLFGSGSLDRSWRQPGGGKLDCSNWPGCSRDPEGSPGSRGSISCAGGEVRRARANRTGGVGWRSAALGGDRRRGR